MVSYFLLKEIENQRGEVVDQLEQLQQQCQRSQERVEYAEVRAIERLKMSYIKSSHTGSFQGVRLSSLRRY